MSLSAFYWAALGGLTWFSLVGKFDAKAWGLGVPVVLSAWVLTEHLSSLRTKARRGETLSTLMHLLLYFSVVVAPAFLRSPWFIARNCFSSQQLAPVLLAVAPPNATRESILLMALGTSMSPDQQVVAIDDQRLILYVHVMHAPKPETLRRELLEQHRRYIRKAVPS